MEKGDNIIINNVEYKIQKRLMSGAYKTTYLATNTKTQSQVVIGESNFPNKPLHESSKFKRINKYLKQNGETCNPRIICPIAIDDSGKYIVTNYFEGSDLFDYISHRLDADQMSPQKFFIPPDIAHAIMLNCVDALIDLHDQLHFCHLDLKPDNIMINPKTLNVGIIDLGAGCSLDDIQNDCLIEGYRGTIGYMSPEIIFGINLLKTSDVFSLGCVFYQLLNGNPLFGDDPDINNLIIKLYRQDTNLNFIDEEFFHPGRRSSNNPMFRSLETIVYHMLRPNPIERLTLKQLRAQLHRVKSNSIVDERAIEAHNNHVFRVRAEQELLLTQAQLKRFSLTPNVSRKKHNSTPRNKKQDLEKSDRLVHSETSASTKNSDTDRSSIFSTESF